MLSGWESSSGSCSTPSPCGSPPCSSAGSRSPPQTTGGEILTLLAVGALFGLVNAIIKPIALLLSLPLIILTLGLFVLVVNALLFWLIGAISDGLGVPFEVDGFWAAFWGAIVVSLVSWLLSIVVKDRDD